MSVKKADIHFRIPEPEKEVIAGAAEMAGKGLSEYARDILMAASDYEKTNNTYAQKDPLKISEAAPLNCSISIRCSEEELNYYREQAKIADCSMPEYISKWTAYHSSARIKRCCTADSKAWCECESVDIVSTSGED